ncbi:T9SS type A sorting domain-containing protein [Salibacter sp.]|uniref:T9SS type A sorting domain-containing protein n=1 Tax=Salibacter sp. TaxID=2010995 RepID=UPI0028705D5D|nr:T9SS type A sorting domain-containing protein [Salibacter sp.]MDR9398011.1 T9SS type A sorting domain-containing protein [Salibacter sp.]MDR9486877.1 T9SS type A sorting domain-containing protein [Salibacter sp.]
MKNLVLILVAVAFVNISFAQLTFSSKEVSLQMEPGKDNKATIEIYNNTMYDIDMEWELVSNDLDDNWSIQFCECNTCYTNDFAPIDQVTQGGMSCPTMSSGGPNAAWYLIVDPGSEPQKYAEWKIVVENITDRIYDTLTFAAEPANSVNAVSLSEEEISVFPNPTSDIVNVQVLNNKKYESIEYDLFNVVGKRVKSGRINTSQFEISTSDLNGGIYFLNLRTAGEDLLNEKLIVR